MNFNNLFYLKKSSVSCLSNNFRVSALSYISIISRVHKRTMFTRGVTKAATEATSRASYNAFPSRNMGVINIYKPNVNNTSHDECQANPILTTAKKKALQHPTVGFTECAKPNCVQKSDCEAPCDDVKTIYAVGHVSHDGTYPGMKFVSSTDLNGNPREQYFSGYPVDKRPEITQPEKTKSESMTENLKNNEEALTNIHILKRGIDRE